MMLLRLLFVVLMLLFLSREWEYEVLLREDWGGLFTGRVGRRCVEVSIRRYRQGRCYVFARAW